MDKRWTRGSPVCKAHILMGQVPASVYVPATGDEQGSPRQRWMVRLELLPPSLCQVGQGEGTEDGRGCRAVEHPLGHAVGAAAPPCEQLPHSLQNAWGALPKRPHGSQSGGPGTSLSVAMGGVQLAVVRSPPQSDRQRIHYAVSYRDHVYKPTPPFPLSVAKFYSRFGIVCVTSALRHFPFAAFVTA